MGRFCCGVHVDRHAAAVVGDPHAAVGEQGDLDPVGVAGQRLVDGVVHDLPDEVVQTAGRGGADVHAGPLADGLEALEDGDRAAGVGVLGGLPGAPSRSDGGGTTGGTRGTGGHRHVPLSAWRLRRGGGSDSPGNDGSRHESGADGA